jgi:hypothetical protein
VITRGLDGEPLVRTWQACGGVLLLAHTFVLVNPPTGKLKDCAETRTASMFKNTTTARIRLNRSFLRIVVVSIVPRKIASIISPCIVASIRRFKGSKPKKLDVFQNWDD